MSPADTATAQSVAFVKKNPMPTTSPNPDLFLARRAAKGDPAAWDQLIELYGERIYNLALRFTGHPAEAEDLTQDIFLKLYRQLNRYRGDVPLMAWALRLSRNLCIDRYRHLRSRHFGQTLGEESLAKLTAEGNPQRHYQQAENRRLVHRALAKMSDGQAMVIILRDLQGFTYEEMATYFEVPIGTVKSRLNRARQQLVTILGGLIDDAEGGRSREDNPEPSQVLSC